MMFLLWVASLSRACAPCHAGTEAPPLPQAGDVLLTGAEFSTGTLECTIGGVTFTSGYRFTSSGLVLADPPPYFDDLVKQRRSALLDIDRLTTENVAIDVTIDELISEIVAREAEIVAREALIEGLESAKYAKQALIDRKKDALDALNASVQISNPEIRSSATSGTLIMRGQ